MSVRSMGKCGSDGGRDGKGTRWMWTMRCGNEVRQGGKGTEVDVGAEGRKRRVRRVMSGATVRAIVQNAEPNIV